MSQLHDLGADFAIFAQGCKISTLLSKAALESESADTVALQVLSLLQEKSHAVEHHLETLSFSLSSETAEKTMPQLEPDFVGRVETIDKDWQELISLANARSNVPKIEFAPLPVKRRELVVNETQKRADANQSVENPRAKGATRAFRTLMAWGYWFQRSAERSDTGTLLELYWRRG
jgi:hypothetical protein